MKGHMMKNVENEGQEISSLRIYAVLCFVTTTFVLPILMLSYVALSGRSSVPVFDSELALGTT